ncbi:MAG: translation initiation factor IF-2 N-terminal domain-containing protein, partial [Terracidiphilus sp.]
MSKVRINDLAREMEVKSRQILDVLTELGMGAGKTHSSSLEDYEADKVRAHIERGSRPAGQSSSQAARAPQGIAPKIDLSHISKPGDVLKAILAKKQEQEAEARQSHLPPRPVVAPPAPTPAAPPKVFVAQPPAAPARPVPRKIFPQPRSAPPIIAPPSAPPAIASRPPQGAVVA